MKKRKHKERKEEEKNKITKYTQHKSLGITRALSTV